MSPLKSDLEAAFARAESAEREKKKLEKRIIELEKNQPIAVRINWINLGLASFNFLLAVANLIIFSTTGSWVQLLPTFVCFFLGILCAAKIKE